MKKILLFITFATLLGCQSEGGGEGTGGAPGSPTSDNRPTVERPLPVGTWGGSGAVFNVTSSGATGQFGCSQGSVTTPIGLTVENQFDVPGTLVMSGRTLPARFAGLVEDGNRMTLQISVVDSSTVMIHQLTLGQTPTGLRNCQ